MKKINTFVLTALLAGSLALTACGNAEERRIDQLEDLVENVEEKGNNYSEQDWKKAEQGYEKIITSLREHKEKLTPEQNREIGRLTARYHKAAFKRMLNDIPGYIDNAANQLKGYTDELGLTSDDDFDSDPDEADFSLDELLEAFDL